MIFTARTIRTLLLCGLVFLMFFLHKEEVSGRYSLTQEVKAQTATLYSKAQALLAIDAKFDDYFNPLELAVSKTSADKLAIASSLKSNIQNDLNVVKEKIKSQINQRMSDDAADNSQAFIAIISENNPSIKTIGEKYDAEYKSLGGAVVDAGVYNALFRYRTLITDLTSLPNSMRQANAAASVGNTVGSTNATRESTVSTAQKDADAAQGTCSLSGNISFTACIGSGFSAIINYIAIPLAVSLTALTGMTMDYVFKLTVVDFANYVRTVYPIWLLIKQITTLLIIFSGLYMGFLYIVGWKGGEAFKRFIPFLILYALFVNFSYPLVRSMIDLSNQFSIAVYQEAIGAQLTTTGGYSASRRLMERFNMQGAVRESSKFLTKNITDGTSVSGGTESAASLGWVSSLMIFGLVIYLAYVFIIISIALVVRTLILVFGVIGSPLLLVDSAIPHLGAFASKGRALFFQALITTTVFSLGLYIVLAVNDAIGSMLGTAGSLEQVILMFLMVGVVHVWAKMISKISKEAGVSASTFVGGVMAISGAGGLAGAALRGTVGRTATHFLSDEGRRGGLGKWINDKQNTSLGRGLMSGVKTLSTASFDSRNTKWAQQVQSKAGIPKYLAGSKKGGYAQRFDAKVKDAKEVYSNIDSMERRQKYADSYGKTFGVLPVGQFTGSVEVRDKTLTALYEKDLETSSAYARATPQERIKMKNDPANKRFVDQYAKIDKTLNASTDQEKIDATSMVIGIDNKKLRDAIEEDGVKKNREAIAKYAATQGTKQKTEYRESLQETTLNSKGEKVVKSDPFKTKLDKVDQYFDQNTDAATKSALEKELGEEFKKAVKERERNNAKTLEDYLVAKPDAQKEMENNEDLSDVHYQMKRSKDYFDKNKSSEDKATIIKELNDKGLTSAVKKINEHAARQKEKYISEVNKVLDEFLNASITEQINMMKDVSRKEYHDVMQAAQIYQSINVADKNDTANIERRVAALASAVANDINFSKSIIEAENRTLANSNTREGKALHDAILSKASAMDVTTRRFTDMDLSNAVNTEVQKTVSEARAELRTHTSTAPTNEVQNAAVALGNLVRKARMRTDTVDGSGLNSASEADSNNPIINNAKDDVAKKLALLRTKVGGMA